MARRSGFVSGLIRAQRESERRRATQLREQAKMQTQAARAVEQARKNYEHAVAADEKERQRLYVESRQTQVVLQNEQLEQHIQSLEHLLLDALSIDPFIDIQSLKQTSQIPAFNPGPLTQPEAPPQWHLYVPPEPTGIKKLLPGTKEWYARDMMNAQQTYRAHVEAHAARERNRLEALAQLKRQYDQQVTAEQERIAAQHAEIDAFQKDLQAGLPRAIVDYFTMILA